MKRLFLLGLLATLASCASESPPTEAPAPAAPPPPPRAAADTCGAADMAGLIGRPRTEIPVPVLPALRRVTCTTCPVTMDFNPRRLNILFDADTGLVREVKCG